MTSRCLIDDYLEYNKETGELFWKKRASYKTKIGTEAGSVSDHGYIVIRLKGKLYYAHRLAW